jgi:LysM repeat protein
MEEDRYFDSSKKAFSDGEIPEEDQNLGAPEKKPSPNRRLSIFLGIGVGLLIILMLMTWFRQDRVGSGDETRLETIENRLQNLETRMNEIQEVAERLVQIDYQSKELVSLIQKMEQTNEGMSERMDLIAQEIMTLQRGLPQTPQPEQKKAAAAAPDRQEAPKVVRHEVQSGETLYAIGRRYGISVEELRRLNDLGNDNTIQPGQKLIVTPNTAQ